MTLPADAAKRDAFLLYCANGNADAATFLRDISMAARMADDLADRDENNVGDLLTKCLVDIPSSRFFRDNFAMLAGAINEAIVGWQISSEFKKSGDRKKQTFGYVYRESTDRIAVAVALITGGAAHSRDVLRRIYEECHAPFAETVEQWVES